VPNPAVSPTLSAVEKLERQLTARIIDGGLAPGTHLREVELSDEYQVGRHTLRAAFDALVRRGLLQRERNCGVFVRSFSAADLAEVYELRAAVEVQAVRALATRGYVPPGAAAALADAKLLDPHAPKRKFVDADLAFHSALVHGAGNTRLSRIHDELAGELLLLLARLVNRYAGAEQLSHQHADLIAIIEAGDPDAADRAIRTHLDGAARWLVEQLEPAHAMRIPEKGA
jgi:DNA-binding GntR family transcriptional regulator